MKTHKKNILHLPTKDNRDLSKASSWPKINQPIITPNKPTKFQKIILKARNTLVH